MFVPMLGKISRRCGGWHRLEILTTQWCETGVSQTRFLTEWSIAEYSCAMKSHFRKSGVDVIFCAIQHPPYKIELSIFQKNNYS